MAKRGDMERVGRGMMRMSRRRRPATDGNKNVRSRARRKSQSVPQRMTSPLEGPDRGNG